MKLNSGIIEVTVAQLLNYRKYIIIPNVSHGFFYNQEADMLVIDSNDRLSEIEIKISIADLKADFKKPKHTNPSELISRLIYAIPEELLEKAELIIPKKYGIITIRSYEDKGIIHAFANWHRMVRCNKEIKPLGIRDIRNLARLGCMRIWSLKQHNNRNSFKALKN